MKHSKCSIKLLVLVFILIAVSNTALALTYTKNSFPAFSGNVISCNGNDKRLSCHDSGNGNNHYCSPVAINSCQAFEGEDNFGSPGCLIVCEKEEVTIQRCSDGTAYGFCSANVPFFCDNGNLIKRASFCGCQAPSTISGEDCISPQQQQKCSDGTLYGECSTNKPLFCLNGNLINKASQCSCPNGQIVNGNNCLVTAQTCSDGTSSNQCSLAKPLFCQNGILVNKASSCGCPSGQVANGDNCLAQAVVCSDGTANGQCSSNKPLSCENGNLVNKASSCGCPGNQIAFGDNCIQITVTQTAQTEKNRLLITKIDAKVDGKTSSNIPKNGKISKDAKPESDIELKIKIKNDFNTSEDIEIQNIDVTSKIEDIDNRNDLEADSSSFDLKAQSERTVIFRFKLPLNVEENTFNIAIEAQGQDTLGNEQKDDANIELEVKKDRHSLKFISFDLFPKIISCDRDVTVNYKVINVGKEDEDAVVEITNDDLNLNLKDNVLIDAETGKNILSRSLRFSINQNAASSNSIFAANVLSEDGVIRDKRTVPFSIEGCTKTSGGSSVELLIPPQEKQKTSSTQPQLVFPALFSFKEGDLQKIMLVLAIIILALFILIIILALIFAATEREKDGEYY